MVPESSRHFRMFSIDIVRPRHLAPWTTTNSIHNAATARSNLDRCCTT